jgi:hypothetical protein
MRDDRTGPCPKCAGYIVKGAPCPWQWGVADCPVENVVDLLRDKLEFPEERDEVAAQIIELLTHREEPAPDVPTQDLRRNDAR